MNSPRSAGALGAEFPYRLSTMCYLEVRPDGAVSFGIESDSYKRAVAGESRLYAVWPGKWSSELYAIDNIHEFARAFGIVNDQDRTGLADHEHQVRWSVSQFEANPAGTYIGIDVRLDCGCVIRDIEAFAAQMRQQQGWDVITSRGWGGGEGSHYVRVRRKSLQNPSERGGQPRV